MITYSQQILAQKQKFVPVRGQYTQFLSEIAEPPLILQFEAHFVGERGLEPPRLAPIDPKSIVYTISPLAHYASNCGAIMRVYHFTTPAFSVYSIN